MTGAKIKQPRITRRLGQNTRDILAEAGYTGEEIDAMIAERVVMTDRKA